MPKPVRIRGKRRHADSEDVIQAPRKAARQRRPPSTLPDSEAPTLENLPTEILQDIFCYGTNLKLPLASPVLYKKLTCTLVKEDIIARLLWPQPKEFDCFYGEDLGELQSALFRQSWVTLDIIRRCSYLYHRWYGHEEVKSCVEGCDANTVEKKFDELERWRKKIYLDDEPKCCWTHRGPIVQTAAGRPMRLQGYDNLILAWPIHTEPYYQGFYPGHPSIPRIAHDFVLPSRLLHGPWTKDKVVLLSVINSLIASSPHLDRHYPGDELTKHCLDNAIREHCLPVVRALTDGKERCNGARLESIDRLRAAVDGGFDAHDEYASALVEEFTEIVLETGGEECWICSLTPMLRMVKPTMAELELCIRHADGQKVDEKIFELLLQRSDIVNSDDFEDTGRQLLALTLRAQNESTGERAEVIERLREKVAAIMFEPA